jgi:hypothetical protein
MTEEMSEMLSLFPPNQRAASENLVLENRNTFGSHRAIKGQREGSKEVKVRSKT